LFAELQRAVTAHQLSLGLTRMALLQPACQTGPTLQSDGKPVTAAVEAALCLSVRMPEEKVLG